MKFKSVIQAIRKRELGYYTSRRIFRYFERKKPDLQPFASDYIFDNRKADSENLLMVLLGFQPFYWGVVLDRVKRNVEQFKEGIYVCLCVPCGANVDAWGGARLFAEKYGFSFLRIKDDLLAQAQNTAIQLHPRAKWIFKIDEDIILPDQYFAHLKAAYIKADAELRCKVGFIGPLINLNGVCSPLFMEQLGVMNEWISRFGKYRLYSNFMSAPVHKSPEAARFIWSYTLPFDEVAEKIRASKCEDIDVAYTRYSIGAILCTRSFWEEIGYFALSPIGHGAYEEKQMNSFCQLNMCSIGIARKILVGHLGFHLQKQACREFFEEHLNEIKHK